MEWDLKKTERAQAQAVLKIPNIWFPNWHLDYWVYRNLFYCASLESDVTILGPFPWFLYRGEIESRGRVPLCLCARQDSAPASLQGKPIVDREYLLLDIQFDRG